MNVSIVIESGAVVNIYLPPPPPAEIPDESLAQLQATIDDANAFAQQPPTSPTTG